MCSAKNVFLLFSTLLIYLGSIKYSESLYKWTALAEGTVEWTATVEFTEGQAEPLVENDKKTIVSVKPGNSNNKGNNK